MVPPVDGSGGPDVDPSVLPPPVALPLELPGGGPEVVGVAPLLAESVPPPPEPPDAAVVETTEVVTAADPAETVLEPGGGLLDSSSSPQAPARVTIVIQCTHRMAAMLPNGTRSSRLRDLSPDSATNLLEAGFSACTHCVTL